MENRDDLLLIMSPNKTSIVISIAIKTRKLDINALNNEKWSWKKKTEKEWITLCIHELFGATSLIKTHERVVKAASRGAAKSIPSIG
jgi:hypothetical protein